MISSLHGRTARCAAVFALLALAASSAAGCGDRDTKRLVITGSSTVAPLAAEIAKRYEATHPGVRIDVQTGGSSRGVRDAREGLADIGMVSRALKSSESDLTAFTIANDGISLILHKNNPVGALTADQVRSIYRGEKDNWKAFGGPDAPITVVNKAEGRSTLELFLKHYELKSPDVKPDVVIGDNEQGIRTVAGDVHAIGYVSVGTAEYDATQAGVGIKLLPVGGVPASIKTVKSGKFPLARPLNLVTNRAPEGLAKDFIEFAQSAEVHTIVEQQYFVPLAGG